MREKTNRSEMMNLKMQSNRKVVDKNEITFEREEKKERMNERTIG